MASGKIQSGGAERTPNAPAVDPLNRGTVGHPVTGLERQQDVLDIAMERHAAARVFRPPATEGWFTKANLGNVYPLAAAELSDADWPADGFSGPATGASTPEQRWRSFYNNLSRRDQQLRAAEVKKEQGAIASSACIVCGSREKVLANGRCWPSCS